MRVLVDTNIILDYLLEREPFAETAKKIIKASQTKRIEGYIAAHTISNIFYILRKTYNAEDRKSILKDICRLFEIEGVDKEIVIRSLDNTQFSDFEDCLQMECARSFHADYIVTRNLKDFENGDIPAVTPGDLLLIIDEERR